MKKKMKCNKDNNKKESEDDGEDGKEEEEDEEEEKEEDKEGSGCSSKTTQTAEWLTSIPVTTESTTARTTLKTPGEMTTEPSSPRTTFVYREDSTSTMSTSSQAAISDLTYTANQKVIGVPVILAATLFSVFLLVVVFLCLLYKSRIKQMWKQKVKQQLMSKRGLSSDIEGVSGLNDQNSDYNSAYSFIDNDVIVSSLPACMATRQNTVSLNDNYNVLDRERDALKNPDDCNASEYDLLNHSTRSLSKFSVNTSGNLYHTVDPVNSEANQESAYDKAIPNEGNMYTRAIQSNVYSSANAGYLNCSADQNQRNDYYSTAAQIANVNEEAETNVYSSAYSNQESIYGNKDRSKSNGEQRDEECRMASQVNNNENNGPDVTNMYCILDHPNIHFGAD